MRLDAILDRFALPGRVPLKLFLQLAETSAIAVVEAESGKTWTYADLAARARAVAAQLQRCGVRPGDRVAWTAPTGIDSIAIWMGIASLGGVDVCVGDGIKGLLLEHILEDCQPVAMVGHHGSRGGVVLASEALRADAPAYIEVVPDGSGATPSGAVACDLSVPVENPPAVHDCQPQDLATIIYTSGTTGPSKGVMLCHHHQFFVGGNLTQQFRVHEGARLYHYSPFNHVTGRQLVVASMLVGGTLVMRDRFSLDGFWKDINGHGITHTIALGSAIPLLLDRRDAHAHNAGSLKYLWASPSMPGVFTEFARRFNVTIATPYGSTEVGIVVEPGLITPDGKSSGPSANSGRMGEYFELAILDDDDQVLPPGQVGEIAVRPRAAWTSYLGYLNRDEATRQTNRNLWYHSGDFGRMDDDGYLFFVDRKQDFIRSKGENISSSEIEQVLVRHPAVAEVAVIPVASELADEDVCAVVLPSGNAAFDALEFYHWCADQLPYFAVPRYVRVVSDLPRGHSGKVEKYKLRSEGAPDGTWDASAMGLRASRAGIVAAAS